MLNLPKGKDRASSLDRVLRQCKDVQDLIAASDRDLSGLKAAAQDLETRDLSVARAGVIRTGEAIQANMQNASEKLSVLVAALEGAVREREMLNHQLAAAEEQEQGARHASLHDRLTGMPNRDLFNDRLEHGLAQASRHGWTLALMFVDLNDFKTINDRYGHDVGDSVLQTIARRLKEHTRSEDTVCRHGGDEFLYLAVDVRHEATVSLIAQKIINEIQAPLILNVRELKTNLSVKASVGISLFPDHGTDAAELVKKADEAMYRAKRDKSGYSFA